MGQPFSMGPSNSVDGYQKKILKLILSVFQIDLQTDILIIMVI
jgi:hypothetical protein